MKTVHRDASIASNFHPLLQRKVENLKKVCPFSAPSAKKGQYLRSLKIIPQRNRKVTSSGRSAAWLAHLHGVQGGPHFSRIYRSFLHSKKLNDFSNKFNRYAMNQAKQFTATYGQLTAILRKFLPLFRPFSKKVAIPTLIIRNKIQLH